jgi:hypothetical protein
MTTLFSYKLFDTGLAPNFSGDLMTLGCCKPAVRKAAKSGDWVVGLAHQTVKKINGITEPQPFVIYIMQVSETISWQEYDLRVQKDPKLSMKIPNNTSPETRCGDAIYSFNKQGIPKQRIGLHLPYDVQRDVYDGRNVLLAKRFWYFGNKMIPLPKDLWGLNVAQGMKSKINEPLLKVFRTWVDSLDYKPGVHGEMSIKAKSLTYPDSVDSVVSAWRNNQRDPQLLQYISRLKKQQSENDSNSPISKKNKRDDVKLPAYNKKRLRVKL